MSITEGKDGRILLHDFGGSTPEAIVAAMGLTMVDLYADKPQRNGKLNIVATYDYQDETGKLLYQVCRLDPKDFRQRRPDPTAKGGWTWSVKGVLRVLFRLPELIAAVKDGRPVWVVEGEKDVEAMRKAGFVGTCNAGGALSTPDDSKWPDSMSEPLRGAEVVVVADKDKAGRRHAAFVAAKLQGTAGSVKVIELPDVDGKPVKDAADFFAAGGQPADLDDLVQGAPEWTPADQACSESTLPPIDNAAALLADETATLPPEIIKAVLHQGLKAVLGSSSKARKTWILLDLATSVAAGLPWWKFETLKGRVLCINFEIPRAFIRARIKRLCEAKGIEAIGNLDVWTLRGHGAALGTLLPRLLARIQTGAYVLIVVDPIYKGLGGRDENSAGDIGELCNEIERLAVETGAAVFYAAHFSKGNQAGKEAIDRIGGSGVWTRDADTIITLTKHKVEGAFTVDLILRNLPEQPPFVVEWAFPLMKVSEHLNPEDLKQAGGKKPEHEAQALLEVLPAKGLKNKDWIKAAREEHGMSERTFYRLRRELLAGGRVLKSKVGGKWQPVIQKHE